MKYKINITIALLLILSSKAICQTGDYNKVWITGTYGEKAIFLPDTVLTYGWATPQNYFAGGQSDICDSLGQLLLISDGFNIYDSIGNLIENGDSLAPIEIMNYEGGFSSYPQSTMFLLIENNKYYFVNSTASDTEVDNHWPSPADFDRLFYSIVDMNANSGAGEVTRRDVPLLKNTLLSKTQMMACRHGNGRDWWLLKQASEVNTVYKFLFTADSVYGPYTQTFATPIFSQYDQDGQSVFSSDGTKYATTCRGTGKIFIADFDRCTGTLSNPFVYDVPIESAHHPSDTELLDYVTQGIAFSPNGRFLYVTKFYNIEQFDLQATNPDSVWMKVAELDTTWDAFSLYSALLLGIDNKLYAGNFGAVMAQMSYFKYPDNKGLASGFCPKCLRFPNVGISTPPTMPNYHLGAVAGECVEGVNSEQIRKNSVEVYPNPAGDVVNISNAKGASLSIYDVMGKKVKEVAVNSGRMQVPIQDLASGVYLVEVRGSDGSRSVMRLLHGQGE